MALCYPVRVAGCDAGVSYPAYGAECRSDKAFTPHPTLMAHHPAPLIWRLLALFRRLNIQHLRASVAAARAVISD